MPLRRLPASLVLSALVAVPVLAACGSDDTSTSTSGARVAVAASDTSCELDRTELTAGETTFAVKNEGSKTTEVYVYGADGEDFTKVLSEVENIGPGTSREMTVDLSGGDYEVACKPGQRGDGIRTAITVAGASGDPADGEAAYDREIELATDGSKINGNLGTAKTGEKIEFKLKNGADTPLILELKDPVDKVAGETEAIEPGATGEIIAELTTAGTWKVIVEGEAREDLVVQLPVS